MRKTGKKVLVVILCLCLIVFAYSAYRLFAIARSYVEASTTYNELSESYVTIAATPEIITPAATEAAVIGSNRTEVHNEVAFSNEHSPIHVNFESLQAVNHDVTGWIYCEGTVINYPVVQGSDNVKYLHALFNGKGSANGSIFIDCDNTPGFNDTNTIIYGHNMNDRSMFGSLRNYKKADYFTEHPFMYLSTPDCDYRLEIFAAYTVIAGSDIYSFNFADTADYLDLLQIARESSAFSADVTVSENDHIVTLSTCTYEYDDARFIVLAKLVKILPYESIE